MTRRHITLSLALTAVMAAGVTFYALPDGLLPGPRMEPLVVKVNLPSYELEVWDGGEVIAEYKVTIGAPGYATPSGEWAIDRVVWNPWWHPPTSRWAEGEKETPPGPNNPMGRVKMRFEGLLFIHGTSREDQLGQARSHGCIRMANTDALALARLIAERTGSVAGDELDRLEANPKATRDVKLARPVRLVISYRLAEEKGGEVRSYEDVYGRGMRPHERDLVKGDTTSVGL